LHRTFICSLPRKVWRLGFITATKRILSRNLSFVQIKKFSLLSQLVILQRARSVGIALSLIVYREGVAIMFSNIIPTPKEMSFLGGAVTLDSNWGIDDLSHHM
jgi:hypothetical protein